VNMLCIGKYLSIPFCLLEGTKAKPMKCRPDGDNNPFAVPRGAVKIGRIGRICSAPVPSSVLKLIIGAYSLKLKGNSVQYHHSKVYIYMIRYYESISFQGSDTDISMQCVE